MFSLFVRFIIQQYITLYLSSLVNLQRLSSTTSGGLTSSLLALSAFSLCSLFSPLTHLLLKQPLTPAFTRHYGTLLENLHARTGTNYNPIMTARWQLQILILVTLREWPTLQIGSVFYLSLLFQAYIVACRPFEGRGANALNFVNEAMTACYLIPCFMLTDYLDDSSNLRDLRESAGKSLVGIIGATAFVNLSVMVWSVGAYVRGRYRLYQLKKLAKARKYVMEEQTVKEDAREEFKEEILQVEDIVANNEEYQHQGHDTNTSFLTRTINDASLLLGQMQSVQLLQHRTAGSLDVLSPVKPQQIVKISSPKNDHAQGIKEEKLETIEIIQANDINFNDRIQKDEIMQIMG